MKDEEIKNKLSPAQVSVMLHKVTEPPYFGRFWDHFEAGTYRCAACSTALFGSADKFDSKTGWPSFKKPLNEKDFQFKSETGPDDKVEIRCKKCKSHLGYVIAGDTPYYRINSVCLVFEESPVAAVITDTPTTAAVSTPATFPTPATTEFVPLSETGTWNLSSIIVGALIGIAIGTLATWLYLAPRILPASSETATTTQDVASTTEAVTSTPETSTNVEPDTTTPEETPVTVPETVVETPIPDNTGATSTQ